MSDPHAARRLAMANSLRQCGATFLTIRLELESPHGVGKAMKTIPVDEFNDDELEKLLLDRLDVALYSLISQKP